MKIISYNVNGIRSAMSKGFVEWLQEADPDIIGLQEIKAEESQIETGIFRDLGYEMYWHPAQKKGYSGVGILTKQKPKSVLYGMVIPNMMMKAGCYKPILRDFLLFLPIFHREQLEIHVKLSSMNSWMMYLVIYKMCEKNILH